ncbi:hypothetical protein SeMB42_g07485 [Synchytrium endobioticum]|uniref:BAR domain-containing protein n=1 Tax=Synchytrium endobioticum TaxID=286115 RepID=A0A507BVJ4_9FUNG|nr:hypothetical protein SeMB42_g07485 [Synchytrium endobioticum]
MARSDRDDAPKILIAKKRPSPEDKTEGMPLEIMGNCMVHFGGMMHEESTYGRLLLQFGEAQNRLAAIQYEYFQKARDGYVGNLNRLLNEMKEYQRLKAKLENRRLDFDAKLNKVHKSNKEKPELEEATRQAQAKYEESLTEATNVMIRLNANNEEEQMAYLLAFLDAEVDYYKQCSETLSNIAKEFASVPRTASLPRRPPVTAANSSSPFGDDPFAPEPSSPLSSVASNQSPLSSSKPNLAGSSSGLGTYGLTSSGNTKKEASVISGPMGGSVISSPGALKSGVPSTERIGNLPAFGGPSSSSPSMASSVVASKNASPALPPRSGTSLLKQVKVTFDFDAESPDEMSIRKGDIINVVTEIDEGWWEGEMADGAGRQGMFPSNYVEVMSHDSHSPAASIAIPSASGPRGRGPASSSISPPNLRSVHSNPNLKGSAAASGGGGGGMSQSPPIRSSNIGITGGSGSALGNAGGSKSGGIGGGAGPCGTCGCTDFSPHSFKTGVCTQCFHKH